MNIITDPMPPAVAPDVDLAIATPLTESEHSLHWALLRTMRYDVGLALAAPAVYGSVAGWWASGSFSWITFSFFIVGIVTAVFAYQALAAVADNENRLAVDAKPATDLPDSPFTLIADGALPPTMLASIGYLLATLSALCMAWLGLLVGWPVFFFAGLGALLIGATLLSPVALAKRGLGEVAVAISFGILPLLAGFYVQAQSLSWMPLAGGLPLACFAFLVLLDGALSTWRRDWLIRKRTLPVILGPARALDLSVVVTMAAYISILLTAVLARLPLWTLAGLATLPLAMGAFADIRARM
ncbi:MAG: prenyltransferase [Anaerolineales bacterium]|nr:prenyltransferase [Anaerolineales bacterium]